MKNIIHKPWMVTMATHRRQPRCRVMPQGHLKARHPPAEEWTGRPAHETSTTFAGFEHRIWIYIYIYTYRYRYGKNVYLVVGWPTPLKNDGVRQLGWWNSQYDGCYWNFAGDNYLCAEDKRLAQELSVIPKKNVRNANECDTPSQVTKPCLQTKFHVHW